MQAGRQAHLPFQQSSGVLQQGFQSPFVQHERVRVEGGNNARVELLTTQPSGDQRAPTRHPNPLLLLLTNRRRPHTRQRHDPTTWHTQRRLTAEEKNTRWTTIPHKTAARVTRHVPPTSPFFLLLLFPCRRRNWPAAGSAPTAPMTPIWAPTVVVAFVRVVCSNSPPRRRPPTE